MKNKKDYRLLKIILISISVLFITSFVCSLKKDLFMDEMISYGLANNTEVPSFKDYTSYTGEELLLDYASVKEGKQFDFKNLVNNQINDTHPPLWYTILNIICSFNTGKWSMWYGLSINIFLSIIIFFAIRWIYIKLIDDKVFATILTYLTLVTNAIISSYIFIRMYTLLITITLLFFVLVINEIFYKKEQKFDSNDIKSIINNNWFYLAFYILIVCGTLTHYHFLLVGGMIGIMLCISLFYNKNYIKLIGTVITAILALLTALSIFPNIINHLFFAKNLHSVELRDRTQISENIINFIKYIYEDVFSYSIIIYVLLAILFIILFVKLKKHNTNSTKFSIKNVFKDTKTSIYIMLITIVVVYYIVLIITIKFKGDRYLLNWFPFFIILLFSGLYNISKSLLKNYKVITLIVVVITVICSNIKAPKMLYFSDDKIIDYYTNNADTKMLICYVGERKWDLATVLYLFRNMKDISIVNATMPEFQRFGNFKDNDDFFVTIFTGLNHERVLNSISTVNDVNAYEIQLDLARYKVYRLFKD